MHDKHTGINHKTAETVNSVWMPKNDKNNIQMK